MKMKFLIIALILLKSSSLFSQESLITYSYRACDSCEEISNSIEFISLDTIPIILASISVNQDIGIFDIALDSVVELPKEILLFKKLIAIFVSSRSGRGHLSFPEHFEEMSSLQELFIGCKIYAKDIPENFSELKLRTLRIENADFNHIPKQILKNNIPTLKYLSIAIYSGRHPHITKEEKSQIDDFSFHRTTTK